MTHEEIIAMAREAGMEVHERKGQIRIGSALLTGVDSTDEVKRFAALVAAKEREACAQVCDAERQDFGGVAAGPMATDACKRVHEAMAAGAATCAAAIRARGQKGGV